MINDIERIIDSANEGIYVTDRERRFLMWNETAERITGYRKAELIGRCCYDNILSHTDREGNALCMNGCPLQAAIRDGSPRGPEIVYLRQKSGKRIAVEVKTAPLRNADGSIMGGVETFSDVTERLERERLLRERKEQLEAVLDNIGDGILFLDTEGNVAVVNHACEELFDLDRQSGGRPLSSLLLRTPLGRALSAAEEAHFRDAAGIKSAEAPQCPGSGNVLRCWTRGIDRSPLAPRAACYGCDAYRGARAFLETKRELVRGERTLSVVSSFIELPETNELWEVIVFHDVSAEKLDAALKVAGAAAHELRQPLQALVILLDLLAAELDPQQTTQDRLEAMQECCDRMDHIIRRMGELTRYQTKDYVAGSKILDIEQSSGAG
jgi:PAS domain S-box-containing protein